MFEINIPGRGETSLKHQILDANGAQTADILNLPENLRP